jgi:glycosyltransferase involved in cell wall biosynthesis
MLRLLAFVQKRPGISPGQRFRIEQWLPHLRARHGIDVDFCVFESERLTEVIYTPGHVLEKGALMLSAFARRANAMRLARDYDAAFVFREVATIGPAFYERVLARAGIPYVVDFDDAIWMENDASKNGLFAKLRFPAKTKTIVRLAQAVTVGNQYLANWSRQHNDNVHIVPTSIELADYDVRPEPPSDEPFVIGWIGSFSTLVHLEQVRSAVETFGKTRKVRFVVVADQPLAKPFANVDHVYVKWNGDREVDDIAQMHIGLMPLLDHEFAKGKCGLKALQYMAVGRPAVVAPVGVNADIVKDGENGFFATTESEWLRAFERLADSADLRRRLGAAGRKTVEEGYSAEIAAAKLAAAVESAVRPQKKAVAS